jgi:hypothetical protein
MKKKFAFKIINQCKDLKILSIKFNWQGEPLIYPELSEIISYAKKK